MTFKFKDKNLYRLKNYVHKLSGKMRVSVFYLKPNMDVCMTCNGTPHVKLYNNRYHPTLCCIRFCVLCRKLVCNLDITLGWFTFDFSIFMLDSALNALRFW